MDIVRRKLMLVQKKDPCVTILSCIAGVIQKQQQLAKIAV